MAATKFFESCAGPGRKNKQRPRAEKPPGKEVKSHLLFVMIIIMAGRYQQRQQQVTVQEWHSGANVPMKMIRKFAREVAERFAPERILLFGSHAYGHPHAASDVDILVIMPARNQLDQAFKIHWAIQPPFPLQLLVRTPRNIEWGLKEGDLFLTEIISKGKVLYEARDKALGGKSRVGLPHRKTNQPKQSSRA
jgi:predicted nucleotidyltransferase